MFIKTSAIADSNSFEKRVLCLLVAANFKFINEEFNAEKMNDTKKAKNDIKIKQIDLIQEYVKEYHLNGT